MEAGKAKVSYGFWAIAQRNGNQGERFQVVFIGKSWHSQFSYQKSLLYSTIHIFNNLP
jgi:hypothetical protein